jgi:hypothetical protein
MDKLIELLDVYEEQIVGVHSVWDKINDKEVSWIISKKFWFIKWLVDNDKIDRDKIIEKSDFMPIVSNKVWDFFQPTEEQELLMLLSIQDNPIEFLVSILK